MITLLNASSMTVCTKCKTEVEEKLPIQNDGSVIITFKPKNFLCKKCIEQEIKKNNLSSLLLTIILFLFLLLSIYKIMTMN